ncbi:MAG: potassium-transporting ATPase subunit KdpC [Bacillota bacterium]
MAKTMMTAAVMFCLLSLLTGVLYPLATAGLARALLPHQAAGQLLYRDGRPVGSALIGQNFTRPEYFHGRPSCAGPGGYDASASGASNFGPTNRKLLEAVARRLAEVRAENGLPAGTPVPADLVTASGSGLDPEISPEAAYLQVARVARARNLPEEVVRALVDKSIVGPELGVLGEPRVNVLKLNLELDRISPAR